jgi:hypothetical protein
MIGPNFSRERASELFNQGLKFVRQAWDENNAGVIPVQAAVEPYGLLLGEFDGWNNLGRRLSQEGSRILFQTLSRPKGDE